MHSHRHSHEGSVCAPAPKTHTRTETHTHRNTHAQKHTRTPRVFLPWLDTLHGPFSDMISENLIDVTKTPKSYETAPICAMIVNVLTVVRDCLQYM